VVNLFRGFSEYRESVSLLSLTLQSPHSLPQLQFNKVKDMLKRINMQELFSSMSVKTAFVRLRVGINTYPAALPVYV
jgi:hypothetical protein